jgi:hypothetical protein
MSLPRTPSVEFIMYIDADGQQQVEEFPSRPISPPYEPGRLSPELQAALDQMLTERPLKRPKAIRPMKDCCICYAAQPITNFSAFPCAHTTCNTCFYKMHACPLCDPSPLVPR